MVERTIAWLARGAHRVPLRGFAKNNAWRRTRTASLNPRWLLTFGLEHRDEAWALA